MNVAQPLLTGAVLQEIATLEVRIAIRHNASFS